MDYIIAVDFDGTLVTDAFPGIGEKREAVWKALLHRKQEMNAKLILWTCRDGESLKEAVAYCLSQGLELDAINDNLPSTKQMWNNNTRKIFANEYWDDRAILVVNM